MRKSRCWAFVRRPKEKSDVHRHDQGAADDHHDGRHDHLSQGVRDAFWLMSMQAGLKGALDCIRAFSETDFTEDLKRFDVPTLIIHGEDDPGAPHGLTVTHKDQFNADLLAFVKA
jgi:pimeloyl-ACP methyl ester carboxylesterase